MIVRILVEGRTTLKMRVVVFFESTFLVFITIANSVTIFNSVAIVCLVTFYKF